MPYAIGYVKLHRRVLDGAWLQHADLWRFWCWCLLKASYNPHKVIVGLQEVDLLPGQFVFGRKSASKELKMSEQTVRTLFSKLISWGNLTTKPTNKYSVVTIVNWGFYQGEEEESTSNLTCNQPATNQQLTTKEEYKEVVRRERKKQIPLLGDSGLDIEEEFERWWKKYPNKADKKPALKAWKKLNPSPDLIERMHEAVEKQIEWRESARRGEFRPNWKNGSTWINQGCWDNPTDADDSDLDRWILSQPKR